MRNLARVTTAFCILGIALSVAASGLTEIRQIDFKNFSFPWDDDLAEPPSDLASPWHWIHQVPKLRVHVANGMHHFYEPGQDRSERERAPLISVDSVTYGDLYGDGRDEAAVHLNYSEGGTANWDYLYVYGLVHGEPGLMAILEGGSRGYGGLVRIAIQGNLLILDFADQDRRVGDCCSEGYIRVRYRWRNGCFVEEGSREKGDLPLNAH